MRAITVAVVFLGCSSAPSTEPDSASSALSEYSPSKAVAYADAHWNDGVGECAEFTSRALRAGGADLGLRAWVPDLVEALSGTPFAEYPSRDGSVTARAGDVVVYSDASGADFCVRASTDQQNCGHAGLVVRSGASVDEILADFHNHAHYHFALSALLGAYTTLRVYHLAPRACRTDADCNHGATQSERVCSDDGECIRGCHSDLDCAGGARCARLSPHWACQ